MYLKSFFIYSVLGYIIEILYGFLIGAKNPESGVLFGPWSLIYGFSCISLIFMYDKIVKYIKLNKLLKFIIVFILSGIIIMFLEFLGGIIIEFIYGFSFWDYSSYKYNIGKYTCIEVGIVWGLFGTFFIYVIKPLLDGFIKKLPFYIVFIGVALMIIDLIFRLLIEFNII